MFDSAQTHWLPSGEALHTRGYTVGTLPSNPSTGDRVYVTDALVPVILSAVAGGGAVVVPVFYNGTIWIVG